MWNQRYATPGWAYGTEPNDFLRSVADRIPAGGRVLCLAEGQGRNAVFLAGVGFAVTAMDLSTVGIERARELARERGVHVQFEVGDLTDYDLGEASWDAIVSIFAHVPPTVRASLHGRVAKALRPGGVFILEAYTPAQLRHKTGGPPTAELMMTLDELHNELRGLDFEHGAEIEREVREGSHHTGRAAVVQLLARKP